MPEQNFNEIFPKRLRYYLNKYNMTQVGLAKHLGVGSTSVYNWCNGIKTPRMSKVDAMCNLFHCKRSDLIEEPNDDASGCCQNEETAQIAQEILESTALRGLFDAARTAPPEDLKIAHDMLMALKKKEQSYRDKACQVN